MKSSNQLKIVLWLTRTMCIASLFFCELTILTTASQAASFNCKQAKTKTERMICDSSSPFGFIETQDEELDIAYQWALLRVNDKQKLIKEQRLWLKDIRNNCSDRECLAKVYRERLDRLATSVQTSGCYTLQPIKDNGKVRQIEPVCKVMEKNLNQFCDQPPMACGLKIAPEFRGKITLPNWKPLNPEANRGLIEEFIRMPWHTPNIPQKEVDALLQEERKKIEQAIVEKRLSFSTAELDLYNLGRPQKSYRLDYGDCLTSNSHLYERERWNSSIEVAPVRVQIASEITKILFKQYFTVEKSIHGNVFFYGDKTYSIWMQGYSNHLEELPPANNSLYVDLLERWKADASINQASLIRDQVCIFRYQPTSGG